MQERDEHIERLRTALSEHAENGVNILWGRFDGADMLRNGKSYQSDDGGHTFSVGLDVVIVSEESGSGGEEKATEGRSQLSIRRVGGCYTLE